MSNIRQVFDKNDNVVYEYKSLNPYNHVTKMLGALEDWQKTRAK